MALIQCPECEREISDQVRNCPHCGYPMKKRNPWKIAVPVIAAAGVCIGGFAVYDQVVVEKRTTYNRAISLFDQGKYTEAARYFEAIPKYRDVPEYMEEIDKNQTYQKAEELFAEGQYSEADALFSGLTGFLEADTYREQIAQELAYQEAEELFAEGSYEEAREKLETVSDAERAQELAERISEVETACSEAQELFDQEQYDDAVAALEAVSDNPRAQDLKDEIRTVQAACQQAEAYYSGGQYDKAREVLLPVADYAQAARLLGQMDADEAVNAYIDAVRRYAFDASAGADTAGQLLDREIQVWCSAAWQEQDWSTDLYTVEEDGSFADPDQALERFAGNREYTQAREMLSANRETVAEQYRMLDTVPAGMEDLYEHVQLLHNAYRDLADLAGDEAGLRIENISTRISMVQSLERRFEEQEAQLKEAVPEKIRIVSSEEETFDFRHMRFGMNAEELIRTEQEAYGLQPEWKMGSRIGYTGLLAENGQAFDLVYGLDASGYVQAAYLFAYDALGEDLSGLAGLPTANGTAVADSGKMLYIEADTAAGIVTILPGDTVSEAFRIVLPGSGADDGSEAVAETETEFATESSTEMTAETTTEAITETSTESAAETAEETEIEAVEPETEGNGGVTVLLPAGAVLQTEQETEETPAETEETSAETEGAADAAMLQTEPATETALEEYEQNPAAAGAASVNAQQLPAAGFATLVIASEEETEAGSEELLPEETEAGSEALPSEETEAGSEAFPPEGTGEGRNL